MAPYSDTVFNCLEHWLGRLKIDLSNYKTSLALQVVGSLTSLIFLSFAFVNVNGIVGYAGAQPGFGKGGAVLKE